MDDSTPEDFLRKVRSIQSLMVLVSTGRADMQDKEKEYAKLRKELESCFRKYGIADPNNFEALLEFYGYYRSKMLTYEERRNFVRKMYNPLETAIDNALKGGGRIEIINEPIQQKPKILFLAANPKDAVRLRLDEEIREIDHKIMLAQKKDEVALVNKGAVRISDLQLYLNQERPTVVHFSGHGSGEGEIILEDNLGNAITVPPEALARLFEKLGDNVHVVVLNACYSAEQAHAISKHIDCVVGMSSSISDKASISFSSAFYLALAMEKSVKEAYDQGITELMLWTIPEEHVPQLLVREGVCPSNIFMLKGRPANMAQAQEKIEYEHGELVDCAHCKGTGWVHSPTSLFGQKCPVCDGVGKIRI